MEVSDRGRVVKNLLVKRWRGVDSRTVSRDCWPAVTHRDGVVSVHGGAVVDVVGDSILGRL